MDHNIDIESELESAEYKAEYKKHLDINNSLIRCLAFAYFNCSRSKEMPSRLFFLSVIDDILQSSVAIKVLATEGIRNTCRREFRYLIELSIKSCFISQKYSEKSVEEQLSEYKRELKSTDISMIDEVNLYFLGNDSRKSFLQEVKRMYGKMCNYVHATPFQIQERFTLASEGRTIGLEGIKELRELNEEMARIYSYVLVLLFHSIPQWCVGDYMVEVDGKTVDSYFVRSRYFAEIDAKFDYKHERQSSINDIIAERVAKIEF